MQKIISQRWPGQVYTIEENDGYQAVMPAAIAELGAIFRTYDCAYIYLENVAKQQENCPCGHSRQVHTGMESTQKGFCTKCVCNRFVLVTAPGEE